MQNEQLLYPSGSFHSHRSHSFLFIPESSTSPGRAQTAILESEMDFFYLLKELISPLGKSPGFSLSTNAPRIIACQFRSLIRVAMIQKGVLAANWGDHSIVLSYQAFNDYSGESSNEDDLKYHHRE